MHVRKRWIILAAAFGLAACAGNPMPGEAGYPYNMSGIYDMDIEAMGVTYSGPADISTSPGGLIYGNLELVGPETVMGDLSGSIVGDTLNFESNYERAGGCTGLMSGEGIITEGGGSASGLAVVDDECAGDLFDATFTMTLQTQ